MRLVRRLATEGDRIFTTTRARELAPEVGLSEGYFRQALHHLTKAGWLVRLRKGLYALASSVPGVSSIHEFEIAMALVNPAAISHWSALHHHGLTEQVPRKVFVLTTTGVVAPRYRKSLKRMDGGRISDPDYQFIQVKPEKFFGTEEVWLNEGRVTLTDPERTLLDGLSKPACCGDFAEVLHAFNMRSDALNLDRIIDYALRLDMAIAKRLGWVLENQGIGETRLQPLEDLAIKGYRQLDPTGPRKGPYNKRWKIQENLPGKITS